MEMTNTCSTSSRSTFVATIRHGVFVLKTHVIKKILKSQIHKICRYLFGLAANFGIRIGLTYL